MFYILSKILYYLVMPYTWVLIGLFVAWRFRYRARQRNRWMWIAFGLFFVFSNRFLANEILQQWEWRYVTTEEIPDTMVGVLLGGMTNQEIEGADRPMYSPNADRIIQVAHLYHAGKIEKILVTGGSPNFQLDSVGQPEAWLIQQTLLSWGVAADDIWVEPASLNTHQNAEFSRVILEEKGITGPVVLVTSAFHMRRSVGCFEKEGIAVIPFPADFKTTDEFFFADVLLPQEEAAPMWRRVFKELTGIVVYTIMGYI